MPSYEPVTAVLRGLSVLEAVAAQGTATIKSLHAATGLPKATLVRLLETLIHAGYVYSNGEQPTYAITARSLTLAGGFDFSRRLASVAAPLLGDFRNTVRWPSDIAIFDRDAMVILETNRQPGMLSVSRQVGSRVTAVRTALGRAYLAFMDRERRAAALHQLKLLTGEPGDMPGFEALLAGVRQRGYATSDQENLPDIRAIAAPVFDGSRVIASANVIVLSSAMTLADLESRHASELLAFSKLVSEACAGVAGPIGATVSASAPPPRGGPAGPRAASRRAP